MGNTKKATPENYIKDIRRKTRRLFTVEQKVLIVMKALRAEISVTVLCRKHQINESQFYKWNKEFLEAGKKRLEGDLTREATTGEASDLQKENARLKKIVADLFLWYDIVKKFDDAGLNLKHKKFMRLSTPEKYEIIQTLTQSELSVKKTLQELGIGESTFYKWYSKYLDQGYDGLLSKKKSSSRQWNSTPQQQKDLVVQVALNRTDLSNRELAHYITDEQQIFIS